MSVRDWVQTLGARIGLDELAAAPNEAASAARDRGDAARDQRNWPAAIEAYRIYLEAAPGDAAIWVQIGHAFKESGAHEDAEAAYRSALALMPQDPDLLLQLGHLMKLRGRQRDAIEFYEAAVLADPSSPGFRELLAIGQRARGERALARARAHDETGTIFFQIDDLLIFLSSLKTVSGIQRTVVEVIRHVIDNAGKPGEPRCAFVYTDLFGKQLLQAPFAVLRNLIDYLDEPSVEQSTIVRFIDELKALAVPASIRPGSCYVMLGAFWGVVNNAAVLAELKRLGVSIGVYLYDIIPIDFPEFCDPVLVNDFAQSFAEAMCFVDFAFAISEFSAKAVADFLEKQGLPPVKVDVVRLAHSLSAISEASAAAGDYEPLWTDAIKTMRGRRFVLYVSTIEARKNHKYLFDIWKLLIAEGIDVPDLVFVGRHGWRVNEFFEQLKSTRYLDGRIRVLHGLTDRELETLYRECAFTAVTSFIEGWGLPVGESLGYGKVCVAAGNSSMPEVGGDLIPYIDPLNVRDGLQTIRRLLTEPALLEHYEAGIRTRFKPRSWGDVAGEILALVQLMSKARPGVVGASFVPIVPAREKVLISAFSPFATRPPRRASQRLHRLLLDGPWHRSEDFGAWLEGAEGGVSFATESKPGEEIVVFIELTVPPSSDKNQLVLSGPQKLRRAVELQPSSTFTVRLVVPTDAFARIQVGFRVIGRIGRNPGDMRNIGIGLCSLTYAAVADGVGRAEILERMLFDGQVRAQL